MGADMRLARCDNEFCDHSAELASAFDPPSGWLVVNEGHEDPLDFCSIGCLASWAAHTEIANHP